MGRYFTTSDGYVDADLSSREILLGAATQATLEHVRSSSFGMARRMFCSRFAGVRDVQPLRLVL